MRVLHIWPAGGRRRGYYLIGVFNTETNKAAGPQLIINPRDVNKSLLVIERFLTAILQGSGNVDHVSQALIVILRETRVKIPSELSVISLPPSIIPET